MPRVPLLLTDSAIYHVTARSNNKEWFYVPMLEAWEVFEEMLCRICDRYGVNIHGFVLMTNHFHLLISTPHKNLSDATRYFMTESSRHIGYRSNRINHVFGGRNKTNVLWQSYACAYVFKYVLRNPVRAGTCSSVEAYPYSTLRKQITGHLRIPLVEGLGPLWSQVPKAMEERLKWLNSPTEKELEALISRALRRQSFVFSKDKDAKAQLRRLERAYGIPLPVDNPVK